MFLCCCSQGRWLRVSAINCFWCFVISFGNKVSNGPELRGSQTVRFLSFKTRTILGKLIKLVILSESQARFKVCIISFSGQNSICHQFVIISFFLILINMMGFPGGREIKKSACQCRRCKCGFCPWVGKIPWRRKWQPCPLFLPGESPWTEEPGRLQSMGSQRVRHDWAHTSTINMIAAFMFSTLYVWLQKSYKMCISNEVHTHTNLRNRFEEVICVL